MGRLSLCSEVRFSPRSFRVQRSASWLIGFVAVVTVSVVAAGVDAAIVSDSASNYTTSPSTDINGVGAITGFSNWTVTGGGTAVSTNTGGDDVWLLNNNSGSLLTVSRTFDTALGLNETFSVVNFAISNTPLVNATGINLNIAGSQVARLYWGGTLSTNWFFEPGGSGETATGLNNTSNQLTTLRMDFTRTTNTGGYQLDFYVNGSQVDVGAIGTGTLAGGSSAIDGFSFTMIESGTAFDAQSISIVPEPSTYAMLLAGGFVAGGATLRRRRRRRQG